MNHNIWQKAIALIQARRNIMDQLFQLQRQIQDLRQEVNNITQVANQLQRAEANNAAQLQRLQQNEAISTQQLQTIQQLCNRLNQDVNIISNVAQQVSSQMVNRPFTTGQFGTSIGNQIGSGQYGNLASVASTGIYSPSQFGSYGMNQITPNDVSILASRFGQGLSPQDMAVSSQYITNQKIPGAPQTYGTSTFNTGTYGTSSFQSIPNQYSVSGYSGSQYIPSYSTSMATPSQFGTGIFGSQSTNMMGSY
jgi:hypothetical protein